MSLIQQYQVALLAAKYWFLDSDSTHFFDRKDEKPIFIWAEQEHHFSFANFSNSHKICAVFFKNEMIRNYTRKGSRKPQPENLFYVSVGVLTLWIKKLG